MLTRKADQAAYRLRTTDLDVLTVAVDAGYSSHGAFTALAMWEASMDDRPYDVEAERSWDLDEIEARLAVAGPEFATRVRAIAADGLFDETFVETTCDPPRAFTYGAMVAHVPTFAAHRRTLVCGALYSAGITDLGAGDPLTWLGDPV